MMRMQKFGVRIAMCGLVAAVAAIGCEGEKQPLSDAAAKIGSAVEKAKDAGSQAKDSAVAGLQKTYDTAKSTFESLKPKVASLSESVKPAAEKLVTDLDRHFKKAGEILDKLKTASADQASTLSKETSQLLASISDNLDELSGMIKK
ncbi:MAG: hypothetical protein U0572_11660 [Phycisphaerales bacterium]